MLPTQQVNPEWLLAVVRRRWPLLVVPFVIGLIGAGVYAMRLPDRYRSTAIVLVTPPQVRAGQPVTTMLPLSSRLRMLRDEVLNRSRLERIILDFDLYREERERGIMEDVVEAMRRDINVSPPLGGTRRSPGTSFTLSYTAGDPRTAHRVAERLTSLFIDENIRQRETIAEGTDQFLTAEVDAARRRLEETERRLEEYKRQYGGELPQLLQTNLTVLQNTQLQIQNLNESINRDRTELLSLQRTLDDITGASPDVGDGPIDVPAAIGTPFDGAVAKARASLDAMLLRLTPDHPDVVRQRRVLQELEDRASEAQLARPLSPTSPVASGGPALTPAERSRQNQIAETRKRIAQVERGIAEKTSAIDLRQQRLLAVQARVDAAPAREAEIIGLTRDYDTLRNRYNQLLSRSEDAKIAANMERRQVSEQFRVVDPPRQPQRPMSSDRLRTTVMGAVAGFGLGIALIGLLEYRDRSFRTEDEIVANLALPVVAVVPFMLTPAEHRRRWRRRWLVSATGVVTLMLGTLVAVWRYGL